LQRIGHLVGRVFREREIILRSKVGVRYVPLSPGVQRGLAAGALLAMVAAAWTLAGHHQAWRLVDLKNTEVTRVEEAYRLAIDSLGAAVDGATEAGRAEGASAILSLVAQNDTLQRHLGEVERRLASAEAERERAASVHEQLIDKLQSLDRQVRSVASKNVELGAVVTSLEQHLTDAMGERGRLAVERDRLARERNALKAEIQELERRQGTLTTTHEQTVAQLAERTQVGIDGLKRLIARTGVDADRLLTAHLGGGQGGPFIAATPGTDKVQSNLVGLGSQIGRLEEMRKLLRSLPVGAPLENYSLMSAFGVRRDPFSGQMAMHNGLDLSAPARTPVHSTAGGTVLTAGWNGEFGNFVEIDHGYGVTTRYGHLSRIHVKVGQRVAAHHAIGLVGSTGRSTGPHVHYEVLVDGKNLNPTKFLEAARYVSKSH
jgi:murein DD-endopeptidase MepM/ murein hydrolase activator NlpD